MADYLVALLLAGSLVFCILVLLAARSYRAVRPPRPERSVPVSVLKPLAGSEENLAANLRSFFTQDYPEFELLFAVRTPDDPAVEVVQQLQTEFPRIASRLLYTGEPPYPNAKVYSLHQMTDAARNDLLVMSDSDIRVTPDFLTVLSAEFQDVRVGLATCPYRAVPGRGLPSTLEAVMMNTEFLSGVLVARMLEGMKFALGPTIAARREVLARIGGFDQLKDYLAEDFVMGQRAAELGYEVILSSYVIEHHIGGHPWAVNARHRLRWCRSTRRSRPAGYVGQIFTNPLPLALLLCVLRPDWWPLLVITVLLRAAVAWEVAGRILRDPLTAHRWWLVPLQDLVSFGFWVAGFFGNTIIWRGRRYLLQPDGRFVLAQKGT